MDKFLCKIDANSQQQFYTKMNQYFLFRIILAVDKGSVGEGCNSFTYINIGLMKTVSQKWKSFFHLSTFNEELFFSVQFINTTLVECVLRVEKSRRDKKFQYFTKNTFKKQPLSTMAYFTRIGWCPRTGWGQRLRNLRVDRALFMMTIII